METKEEKSHFYSAIPKFNFFKSIGKGIVKIDL